MQIRYEYELNQQLNRLKGLLLLNTWTSWSLQCRTMYNVMQKIKSGLDYGDEIAFIDWHHHRELATSLHVYGVPTLFIFAAGREVERFSGVTSEAVLQHYIEAEKKAPLPIHDQAAPERDVEQIDPVSPTSIDLN